MAQRAKDPTLLLLWLGFDPRLWNFQMLWAWPKKKRKKNVIPGSRFVRVSGQGRKKTPPGDVSLDWPLLEAAGAEFYGTI